ncbi:ABC transporter substrate-binding protein [Idiomarina sp. PL1-037]|uniref:MlaC/ttg2D family ABC transporter substrate-binding protein n=1 Tax=unclassified Idiomarina TaxID=2614829 RepID=UPI00294AF7A0|nr:MULTISPECIES: ABC transporter substrate-binding protein [unclassified Idiomarina]MDV6327908.1 ABC transporter substrate-binding protein [Idiomarina sp. Sol25]WQC53376.1 ABC transporter substrate-binding protein [Idiomarina sp. PL1-037]
MAVKQWIMAIFATLVLVASASADLIRNDDPQELLKEVAEKTFDRIASDREKIDENPNYLKEIVEDEMMPYVDNMYASKKVLGRYLRDTTKEQRQRFYRAFYDYLVATYARAFTQYDEDKHKVSFEPSADLADDARSAVVRTRVKEEGRPEIRLDFRIRYDSDEEIWKAYDLVVEGVSLLNSKQSEISSVIRANGIDKTIELIEKKAAEPIKADEEVENPAEGL